MLQLRYRDVSDASEEPNLMVDEEESGTIRREPLVGAVGLTLIGLAGKFAG
jgi:hypothetical protein